MVVVVGGYNENVVCFISAGSGCVNKHLFANTSVCILYPHKGNRTPILYWHSNTEWMMSSFLNRLFNKIWCWAHILYMVGWNENSRFQTPHQCCEIAPPWWLHSDKSHRLCEWEWVSEGSTWIHITQLVIKWKSVPHISPSHKINSLSCYEPFCWRVMYFTVQFMRCMCVIAALSLCVPHICCNERQEKEPWHQGLTWEPALLSLHFITCGGLSLLWPCLSH